MVNKNCHMDFCCINCEKVLIFMNLTIKSIMNYLRMFYGHMEIDRKRVITGKLQNEGETL